LTDAGEGLGRSWDRPTFVHLRVVVVMLDVMWVWVRVVLVLVLVVVIVCHTRAE
jgi:hypothetical protein